jgi:hypothetical protein
VEIGQAAAIQDWKEKNAAKGGLNKTAEEVVKEKVLQLMLAFLVPACHILTAVVLTDVYV